MGTASGNPTWVNAPSTTTPISAQALNNIEDALDQLSEGGESSVGVHYTGSSWPARPTSSNPVMFISTKNPEALEPAGMQVGDMWIRHPDAVEP